MTNIYKRGITLTIYDPKFQMLIGTSNYNQGDLYPTSPSYVKLFLGYCNCKNMLQTDEYAEE